MLIFINLAMNLIYPIFMIQELKSHFVMAMNLMIMTTGQILKLISFHHVIRDNRSLIIRAERQKEK